MQLAGFLLFCIIGGCFFALGVYTSALPSQKSFVIETRQALPDPTVERVIVGLPDRSCQPFPCHVCPRSPQLSGNCERQVGTLSGVKESGAEPRVLPLFASKSCANRDRFFYTSRTDGYNPILVPVFQKGRNCMTDRIGCETLYDGDIVQVPALGDSPFVVSLYDSLY